MAGSLNHIVDAGTGKFTMDSIDNLGDAHEALHDCYFIIFEITGGHLDMMNRVLDDLGMPKIQHKMIGVSGGE